jgi:pilus assembly protein FimV
MPCRSPNYWPENVPLDRLECSVRQLKLHQLGLGLLLALSSGAAIAVSLGQVQMRSSLGQPLLADIPIYDADEQDLESLTVALASESAFRRLGLERRQYQDIQVQVIEDENGQLFVQLQSVKPFNEPVFNVLLDANWQNGGHLVREFTALVDPPYIAKTAVQTIEVPTVLLAPVVAAPEVSPNRTPSIPTGSQAPEAKALAAKPAPVTVPSKPKAPAKAEPAKPNGNAAAPSRATAVQQTPAVRIPATADNQLLVETGDNLSKIAGQHKQRLGPTPISLNQMMNAIQRANPEAFINGNPNLLKRGSIVRLPDAQQVVALLPEDSANLLQAQWAKKVVAQPAPVLNAANKLNKQGAAAQSRAPAAAAGANSPVNQGRLKIVPTVGSMNNAGSQSGASKSGQGQELRAENAVSQEEIAARQSEITTLKNQLDDAAKLQVESKRLIELQNSQIKQLTKRMQDLEKSDATGLNATAAEPGQIAVAGQSASENPWYFSPYAVIIGMLLIAALLGFLLKRKPRPVVVRRYQSPE